MKFTEGGFKKWGYELAEREFGDALASGRLVIKDCIADAFFAEHLVDSRRIFGGGYLEFERRLHFRSVAAMVGGIGIAPGANINYNTGHAIF